MIFLNFYSNLFVRLCGVVGRIPAFQLCAPGSIPGRVRDFNLYPGTGCVYFLFVLSCVVSSGGPVILLATGRGRLALVYLSSVQVHSLYSAYRHLTYWYSGCLSEGV